MDSQGKKELFYFVSGLWCQTCAATVESMATSCNGVRLATLNFATKILRVELDPRSSSDSAHQDFAKRVHNSGFSAKRLASGWIQNFEAELAQEMERKLRPVPSSIVFFLAMWSSMFAFAGYIGEVPEEQEYLLACLATVAGLPALLLGVQPFARAGYRALRNGGRLTLDLFITLGAASAGFFSLTLLYSSQPITYVDSAAMILSLLLLAKHLEARLSHGLSSRVLEATTPLQPEVQVHRRDVWVTRPVSQIRADEMIRVEPGQTVPLDGKLLSPKAKIDRHLVTGECEVRNLVAGDEVLSGMVAHSRCEFTVVRPLGRRTIDNWAESALISPTKEHTYSKLLAKVETRLVQISLTGALLVFAVRTANTGSLAEGLEGFFIGVLIFCPCLFAAILPIARQMASLYLRKQGILLYRPEALFDLSMIGDVYLDKTGTLEAVHTLFEPGISASEKIQTTQTLLHSLRHHCAHPILRGLPPSSREIATPTQLTEVAGEGVVADFPALGRITVGRAKFVQQETGGVPIDFPVPPHFPVVALGRTPVGLLVPKTHFDEAGSRFIKGLRERGLRVSILSGDPDPAAFRRYETASVSYQGNLSPSQKARRIKNPALFVGDGLNDTLALARAQVSCRLGERARDFAPVDLHIRGGNLVSLLTVLRYSKKFTGVLKQTAVIALLYNAIALTLASSGLFSPLGAVVAMLLSFLILLISVSRLGYSRTSVRMRPT